MRQAGNVWQRMAEVFHAALRNALRQSGEAPFPGRRDGACRPAHPAPAPFHPEMRSRFLFIGAGEYTGVYQRCISAAPELKNRSFVRHWFGGMRLGIVPR